MGIKQDWKRIEEWLQANAEEIHRSLEKPAREAEITAAEKALGLTVPKELRALLLLVNGSNETGVFGKWAINDTRQIVSEFKTNIEVAAELAGRGFDDDPYWKASYIPVMSDGAGNSMALDTKGEGFFEVSSDGEAVDFFDSLSEAIATFAADLRKGAFVEEDGDLCRRRDGEGYGFL